MYFKDRKDAAFKLIPLLANYKNEKGIVLAVPRGGVPVAYHVARQYGFPLDLLMTKKIGHPSNPEFAIGAVSLEDFIIDKRQDISPAYINEKIKSIRESLQERYKLFMGHHKPLDLKNKIVIIIDDGVATGNTILSAIPMIRKQGPKKIVVAVPVSPPETAKKIAKEVDDFICPYMPKDFFGVGYHYRDFSEVSDEEVILLLKSINGFQTAA